MAKHTQPSGHLAHVQRFLTEMYQTMIDPVEDFRGNIEELCELLLNRAREDREVAARHGEMLTALEAWEDWYNVDSTEAKREHARWLGCRAIMRERKSIEIANTKGGVFH